MFTKKGASDDVPFLYSIFLEWQDIDLYNIYLVFIDNLFHGETSFKEGKALFQNASSLLHLFGFNQRNVNKAPKSRTTSETSV